MLPWQLLSHSDPSDLKLDVWKRFTDEEQQRLFYLLLLAKLKTKSNLEMAAASVMDSFNMLELVKIRAKFSSLKGGLGASLIREIKCCRVTKGTIRWHHSPHRQMWGVRVGLEMDESQRSNRASWRKSLAALKKKGPGAWSEGGMVGGPQVKKISNNSISWGATQPFRNSSSQFKQ